MNTSANLPVHTLESLRHQAPSQIRQLCRSGAWRGPTAGLAQGHVQANLMIVPREAAYDFLLFCQRNPKPCPLIEVVDAGSVMPACASGADLRTDVPGYRIYEHGELRQETDDVTPFWREDLVSFLLGCSFSFENALIEGGVPLRHVAQGINVAMYKTSIACQPAGRFAGNMVVSMRPVKCSLIARAVTISARYPQVHGAPLHIGDPAAIGIADLSQPDFGDAVRIEDDELPVFWACGVTPQYVAQLARIPFCISHSPGKMLVTDFKTE
ncbi:MAG: putative hydro-lyase [Janthinobacterium lividum]